MKFCLEHGINFFDTAESYGLGMAETSLGKAFKELNVQREKIVVSTKLFRSGMDPNDSFLSRKHNNNKLTDNIIQPENILSKELETR